MDFFFPFIYHIEKKKELEPEPLYIELYPPPPPPSKKEDDYKVIIIEL